MRVRRRVLRPPPVRRGRLHVQSRGEHVHDRCGMLRRDALLRGNVCVFRHRTALRHGARLLHGAAPRPIVQRSSRVPAGELPSADVVLPRRQRLLRRRLRGRPVLWRRGVRLRVSPEVLQRARLLVGHEHLPPVRRAGRRLYEPRGVLQRQLLRRNLSRARRRDVLGRPSLRNPRPVRRGDLLRDCGARVPDRRVLLGVRLRGREMRRASRCVLRVRPRVSRCVPDDRVELHGRDVLLSHRHRLHGAERLLQRTVRCGLLRLQPRWRPLRLHDGLLQRGLRPFDVYVRMRRGGRDMRELDGLLRRL